MKKPRGFSLTELLLALTVLGAVIAVFTPVLHTSGKQTDTQIATGSIAETFTAATNLRKTWQNNPTDCHPAPASATDPNLYTPCQLAPHAPNIHLTEAATAPHTPTAVSITTTSTQLAAATISTPTTSGQPNQCFFATRDLTTGEETHWVLSPPSDGCAAAPLLTQTQTQTCPTGAGKSWANACRVD